MVAFLLILNPVLTRGDDWYVRGKMAQSGDGRTWETAFKTIQEGIDAAAMGDTVAVAEGTYLENIHFDGKNIVLTSSDPLNAEVVAKTIIDGNQAGSVVTFLGTEDETCVVSGFTIRNGKAERGGGIYGRSGDNDTHATIRNNRIEENRARWGAGVLCCDGPIRGNTIKGNVASEEGGGICSCDGVIEDNIINGNSAGVTKGSSAPGDGGGLAFCDGTIQSNAISQNSGSGLHRCGGVIQSNIISANSGRGLHDCDGTIQNNIIAGNSGGGLSLCHGLVQNNTIWGNVAHQGGALKECNATLVNCIIWGNGGLQLYFSSTPSYSCIEGWLGGGNGNIPFDPYFVDAENGDFHLQPWSPCIDAGDPESDFSNEPEPNGGRVNMGAYGNTPEAATKSPDSDGDGLPDDWEMRWFANLDQNGPGDADGDGVPNVREYLYAHDPTAPAETLVERLPAGELYQTIQSAMVDAADGDEIVAHPGTYVENVAFVGKNVVLRSTDAWDSSVITSTIIDGSGRGPTVAFSGTEDETCVLSGFTIQNGTGYEGGGISGGTIWDATHATIQNNRIIGNSAQYGGAMAYCYGTIQNNVIAWNSAYHGGGIARSRGTILNNTIYGNEAWGLYDCEATIRNCIIWKNGIEGSTPPTYSCIERWMGGGEGNIVYYPYFVDAANGDFHLMNRSPCIDAGDPASSYSNEPEPHGGRINMGAYGNTPEAASKSADTDGDGLPDDWEMEFFGNLQQERTGDPDGDLISNIMEYYGGTIACLMSWCVDASMPTSGDGRTWETAFKTIQEAIDAADSRDTITVAEGIYIENIRFNGKNIILQSAHFAERGAVGGTIIDGNQVSRVVAFSGTEDETCILEGFVIRNGKTEGYGGGIYGWGSDGHTRATIRNNIIIGNSAEDGGAIAHCAGAIENNTIYGNTAEGAGALLDCPGMVRNCIIWGNKGTEKAQLAGDTHPTYCCIEDWRHGGEGSIIHHPYFVDAANGDFHLRSWSPSIDAGDPASAFSNEPEPNGSRVNMGVYGNTAEATSRSADSDEDGLPDDWEMEHFGDLAHDAVADPDSDLISNMEEYRRGYNPAVPPAAWYVDRAVTVSGEGTSWERAFKTIHEGIDAASDGDNVIVAKGVYRENVHFRGKDIKLTSTDPLDLSVVAETIIDGMKSGSVVTFGGNEDETCLLAGFTIRNGEADSGAGINGGPWTQHTLATIEHNIIVQNRADWVGGGVCNCDGMIQSNVASENSASRGGGLSGCNGNIENNTISGNSGRESGGGLHNCNGTIHGNTISGNSARQGGGVHGCGGTIWNNTISKNSAEDFGGGLAHCNGLIVNCMIIGNSALGSGGGLVGCDGEVLNNTIVGNGTDYTGGGLYQCQGTITNCIIWGNTAPEAPQLDFEGSSDPMYCCVEGLSELTNGNINADPVFVSLKKNDYHLQAMSPCINAGTDDVPNLPATDMDGESRPFGPHVDIGADEYVAGDMDALPDHWEMEYFGTLEYVPEDDPDGDALINADELLALTDPTNPDTDGDGLDDAREVSEDYLDPLDDDMDDDGLLDGEEVDTYGTDPNKGDTDNDTIPDKWEVEHELDPLKQDATDNPDSDGLTNILEYHNSSHPHDSDTDGDGLEDGAEVFTYETNPTVADTDGDGKGDWDEVFAGTDPLDPQSAFRIIEVNCSEGGAMIEWSVVPGRVYGAYFSTDLETWSPLGEARRASHGDITFILADEDSFTLGKGFYRIEVRP